jgi:hypothetical protein
LLSIGRLFKFAVALQWMFFSLHNSGHVTIFYCVRSQNWGSGIAQSV